jgi:outer membrane protein OmpA-like peptidoglycan-associated protein
MTSLRTLRRAAALVLLLAPLAGCLTPHAKPEQSQAIKDALAREHAPMAAACPQTQMSEVSPVEMGFAFGEAALPDMIGHPLAAAARWLSCRPDVPVVVKPDADAHGDEAEQNGLARRRAEAVAAYLTSQGVARERIAILARGAAEPSSEHFLVLAEGRRW